MMISRRFAGAALAAAITLLAPAVSARDLRLNINADPEMIDPITYSALIAGDVLRNVYEGFSDVGRGGDVEPRLALKWTPHSDNLGWRFELRRDVKFHSGRPFTAKDVKQTFERLLAPGSKAGLALLYVQKIEGAKDVADGKTKELIGVKVVDDHTLDVRFTATEVLFPVYPFMFFDAAVIDEKGPEWFLQASAGTGSAGRRCSSPRTRRTGAARRRSTGSSISSSRARRPRRRCTRPASSTCSRSRPPISRAASCATPSSNPRR